MEHLPQQVPPTLWERILASLAQIGTFFLGMGVMWGAIRGWPKFLNHGRLIAENNALSRNLSMTMDALKIAESAAKQYREAADSYKELYHAERARTEEAYARLDEATSRAETAVDTVDTAIIFIVDLLNHIKSERPMKHAPPIPEELEDAVHEAYAKRAEREVPKADHPFRIAPEEGA
jgi:hypothetical protein